MKQIVWCTLVLGLFLAHKSYALTCAYCTSEARCAWNNGNIEDKICHEENPVCSVSWRGKAVRAKSIFFNVF